jgi:hypothetical protein
LPPVVKCLKTATELVAIVSLAMLATSVSRVLMDSTAVPRRRVKFANLANVLATSIHQFRELATQSRASVSTVSTTRLELPAISVRQATMVMQFNSKIVNHAFAITLELRFAITLLELAIVCRMSRATSVIVAPWIIMDLTRDTVVCLASVEKRRIVRSVRTARVNVRANRELVDVSVIAVCLDSGIMDRTDANLALATLNCRRDSAVIL